MKFRRGENEERKEAEEALQSTREEAARIKRKEAEVRGLFKRIADIRRRNHIAEAVRDIMEAR